MVISDSCFYELDQNLSYGKLQTAKLGDGSRVVCRHRKGASGAVAELPAHQHGVADHRSMHKSHLQECEHMTSTKGEYQ